MMRSDQGARNLWERLEIKTSRNCLWALMLDEPAGRTFLSDFIAQLPNTQMRAGVNDSEEMKQNDPSQHALPEPMFVSTLKHNPESSLASPTLKCKALSTSHLLATLYEYECKEHEHGADSQRHADRLDNAYEGSAMTPAGAPRLHDLRHLLSPDCSLNNPVEEGYRPDARGGTVQLRAASAYSFTHSTSLDEGRMSRSPATHTYSVGRRKILMTKSAMSPPTMTMANGRCESEPMP